MTNTIEKQLLEIGHDPVFFKKESTHLRKLFTPDEKIIGFIDGWIESLKTEGTAYITNHRLIAIGFLHNEFIYDDLPWKSLIKIKSDLSEALSEFSFIAPFKSIYVSNIESRLLAKEFYFSIKKALNKNMLPDSGLSYVEDKLELPVNIQYE